MIPPLCTGSEVVRLHVKGLCVSQGSVQGVKVPLSPRRHCYHYCHDREQVSTDRTFTIEIIDHDFTLPSHRNNVGMVPHAPGLDQWVRKVKTIDELEENHLRKR